MWLKIVKVVAQVAVSTGAVEWAKKWVAARLKKQIDKGSQKVDAALKAAGELGLTGADLFAPVE